MLGFSVMHHGLRELHHHRGFRLPRDWRDWELPEDTMPESAGHDDAIELIRSILVWWARSQRISRVVHNMGIRWMKERPSIGVDPDVAVLRPAPPNDPDGDLSSVRTWEAGHTAPIMAIEVVSKTNARKDYEVVPEKYDASGTQELCVFDPHLAGPRGEGGPHRMQVWRRDASGHFHHVYAGEGPVYSRTLGGYFIAVDEGRKLRVSNDEAGLQWWPTSGEVAWELEAIQRAEKLAERKAKEAAQKGEQEALARVAELEALLAKAMNLTKK
jgi:Uma2 family endonuclease